MEHPNGAFVKEYNMFKGFQKVSLIDYPGVVASTLFTGGCNFRCSWCHNWSLVEPALFEKSPDIPEDYIKSFLLSRKGKIRGVCVSGGEPTLWQDQLRKFFGWCKSNGFLVKLDTNGYKPEVIKSFIDENLIDFIAMDIKNLYDKYPETVGVKVFDVSKIKKSIEIIKNSKVSHQFRTTIVPNLVNPEDIKELSLRIGESIITQEYRQIRR